MYAPVPASVMATNGQILKGLLPGVGLGPVAKLRRAWILLCGSLNGRANEPRVCRKGLDLAKARRSI